MKKLESLNSGKFLQFENDRFTQLNLVIGGWRQTMSHTTEFGGGHDVAGLTDKHNNPYDGRPGDGTAGDWSKITWLPGYYMIGPGGDEGDPVTPPVGTPYTLQNAETGDLMNSQII